MPSYPKAWIAKQKALEKMHSGWDASYNEVWQWCQVLERYVLGCITDLETAPAYYNDRLLRGCQVFKRLFWTFKQCRDAFVYCKLLVQIDGTFMYGRYTYRLLLAVAQDGSGDTYSHLSQMNVSGRLYRLLHLSCYRIENCIANQRVDLAQVEYSTIWISEKQPTNKNCVDGVGT
ncbi:hypothetical protein J1N35_007610 [Gossypium stocksii]|uniref:Uncharacterized protein n=1 Tax=Gossypium stocksii TaxID=47602 RepID=A0A9D3W787_9ROSI|nr:hypothetical protein J1N35_007610 [Gossypium stocksii]